MIGERTIGTTTFSRMPLHLTPAPAASAAPPRPPMRACEEDEGSPRHQVRRFQPMAPTSAAAQMVRPREPVGASMMPLPTVAATPWPKNAPARFAAAAMASATRGVSARVEIDVAIAFAESWKPLV
ncbi:hypothetical protein GCM10025868_28010 [Angustibacter aerolatus]|uniref:Uncharacterized protein n=1 Tax=Angustibacter aerolatus TaxID=1162965 RepID=A0ABQ6JH48_9ACTN|nr:hypothetical protein GCM10025868_28010 [Angustibacter aerolatus]